MIRVPSKILPPKLKTVLKNYGFAKREIAIKVDSAATVYGNTHAPEYDNFDYSYAIMVNLSNGVTDDLQTGMNPTEHKTVSLNKDDVIVEGDKHAHYASLTMNSETFSKHFPPEVQQQLKEPNRKPMTEGVFAAKKILAEIKSLERRIAGNYLEQLEHGMKEVHDALKHLEKNETVRKMLQEIEHMEHEYDTYMIQELDKIEPL